MAADTVRIQGNVDYDLAKRVNKTLHSLGITPTVLINTVCYTISNTGELPVQTKRTSEQRAPYHSFMPREGFQPSAINTPEKFNKLMGTMTKSLKIDDVCVCCISWNTGEKLGLHYWAFASN